MDFALLLYDFKHFMDISKKKKNRKYFITTCTTDMKQETLSGHGFLASDLQISLGSVVNAA